MLDPAPAQVLMENGGVVGFGRGHLGQLTGGTRGPHAVKPSFSWALSKGQPVAVEARDDCTCTIQPPSNMRAAKFGLLRGGRGRAFDESSPDAPNLKCFGKCPKTVVQAMFEASRRVLATRYNEAGGVVPAADDADARPKPQVFVRG